MKRILGEKRKFLKKSVIALKVLICPSVSSVLLKQVTDKTQTFHDQIEVKQKELQPWTSKINAKQAEIDIATSERDALIKKAEAAEEARKQAETNLDSLQGDHRAKVRCALRTVTKADGTHRFPSWPN